MEPENRIETNETGFCAKHFKQMYDTRANRLGLGLILHTHLHEQNQKLDRMAHGAAAQNAEPAKKSFFASLKSGGDHACLLYTSRQYVAEHDQV